MDRSFNNPAILLAAFAAGMRIDSPPTPKRKKRCLVCGVEHYHNNSFCSAKCCKSFKTK